MSTPDWDRVQALFVEALELDSGAREALLSRSAAADPDLVREVRSLLEAHGAASGFLADAPVAPPAPPLRPGDRLGPWRVVSEIGHGGMGVVYRAVRDGADFTQDVAVKVIDPGLHSGEILRRFQTERRILALLDHPGIARLIDGGTAPDGRPFLVMDCVEGKPLVVFCDEARLPVEARLRIFLEVLDAVQFAHERLVIHRDLKPDNILVTPDGSPRLLDFGIAKLLAPDTGTPQATVTAPMNRMMTPEYASPEQMRGEAVTVATDVYSLGVVLYELLSGAKPFRFATRTPEEVLRVVATHDPPPPSAAIARSSGDIAGRAESTRQLRRRLSGDLDHIVLRAMEKDPARRYATVDRMADDLRRHLDGLPVTARGRATASLVSRSVRRHRAAVTAGALVALSLIAGLAGTSWQAGVARRERDRATRRFDEVRSLAHAVVFDLHDAIINVPGATKAREILIDRALTYLNGLAGEAAGDPSLQNELGVAYGKIADVEGRPVFTNLGRSDVAMTHYRRSLELLSAAAAAQPESLAFSRNEVVTRQRIADLLRTTGRTDEAWAEARIALERVEALCLKYPDDPFLPGDLILSHDRAGDWALADADTARAIAERRFCREFADSMYVRSPDAGWRRSVLVQSCKSAELIAVSGDREEALALYRRAGELGRQAVAEITDNLEPQRDLSTVYAMTAVCLASGGRIDSALAVYRRGMAITEALVAADPDDVLGKSDLAGSHVEIGMILMTGRRHEDAEAEFRAAADILAPLAEADTLNMDFRRSLARSERRAGDACAALARGAHGASWSDRAAECYARSLEAYRVLERRGALSGDDANAPRDVALELAKLRTRRG